MTQENTRQLLKPVVHSSISSEEMKKAVELVKTRTDFVASLKSVVGVHRFNLVLSTGGIFPVSPSSPEELKDKLYHAANTMPNPQEGAWVACHRMDKNLEDAVGLLFQKGEWIFSFPDWA